MNLTHDDVVFIYTLVCMVAAFAVLYIFFLKPWVHKNDDTDTVRRVRDDSDCTTADDIMPGVLTNKYIDGVSIAERRRFTSWKDQWFERAEDYCKFFAGKRDSNGDMAFRHCCHPENQICDDVKSNCTRESCPRLK